MTADQKARIRALLKDSLTAKDLRTALVCEIALGRGPEKKAAIRACLMIIAKREAML